MEATNWSLQIVLKNLIQACKFDALQSMINDNHLHLHYGVCPCVQEKNKTGKKKKTNLKNSKWAPNTERFEFF